jgi:hypothetical protein
MNRMRFLLALLLPLLLPLAAMGKNAVQCWLPYAGFEERVPHLDIERCPGDDPKPAEGFCRIAIQGNEVFIYAFRQDEQAGGPCLVRVHRQDFNSFVALHGTTYRTP